MANTKTDFWWVCRLVALVWTGGEVRGGLFWLIPFTAPYVGGLLALLTYRYTFKNLIGDGTAYLIG